MRGGSRFVRAFRAMVDELTAATRFLGCYRYRVVSQVDNRLNLQIVSKSTGLPDALLVPWRPGAAGHKAVLQPGAIVLLGFADGDPAMPVVLVVSDPDDPAWLPSESTFTADDMVHLGSGSEDVSIGEEVGRVVRYGDVIMFPSGSAATPTALPIIGSAPGAVGAPAPPISVAKVRADGS